LKYVYSCVKAGNREIMRHFMDTMDTMSVVTVLVEDQTVRMVRGL